MWPDFNKVSEYIAACPVCSWCKSSNISQSGSNQPLPVTHHPWSDFFGDFVMELPLSESKMVSLTVVDRFSEMARFIPQLKLPSAQETGELLPNNIFRTLKTECLITF